MQDVADCIVKRARTMPVETGVALRSNRARIAKVAVTGGFGLEVSFAESSLLFPMAEIQVAVESFLTSAHMGNVEFSEKHHPVVYHGNGVPLLRFEWNSTSQKVKAHRSVVHFLRNPPLCRGMETPERASVEFDSRGCAGWDVESV